LQPFEETLTDAIQKMKRRKYLTAILENLGWTNVDFLMV
jgi:hypothetical protein